MQFDFMPMGGKHARNATIGFISALVSDCSSNSLRVLKTTRQTALEPIGYLPAAKMIIEKDGWVGLFGRGLKTRILTNGLQGALFTIGWRTIQEFLEKREKTQQEATDWRSQSMQPPIPQTE